MARSEPASKGQPVLLDFAHSVDEEWVDAQIDETGIEPPDEWTVEIDLREVTPSLRRELRAAHRDYMAWPDWFPTLPGPIENGADSDVVAAAMIAAVNAERDRLAAEEKVAARAERDRVRAAQMFQTARDLWVPAHGSRRLRLAAAGGYELNRLYATERAAREFPGAWVDTAREASWRDRANPSEEALLLEEGVRTRLEAMDLDLAHRIVWVNEWPAHATTYVHDETPYMLEQDEALVISGWLGRWNLLLPVDEDYHAPSLTENAESA